jgi:hypothetical protein
MSIVTVKLTPQNFSIPAGYNQRLTFAVDPAMTPSLVGTTIWWRVYEEEFGIADLSMPVLIEKFSPGDIVGTDSPLQFTVQLYTADTIDLLRNYYHEATILDAQSQVIGGLCGIMTVTETQNRESGVLS